MDFRRRRPSRDALAWVERELGVRVVGLRRMAGGIIAAVHRLTVEHVPSGRREPVVLRQYEHHGEVEREAGWGWRLILHSHATTTAYGPKGKVLHSHSPPAARAG